MSREKMDEHDSTDYTETTERVLLRRTEAGTVSSVSVADYDTAVQAVRDHRKTDDTAVLDIIVVSRTTRHTTTVVTVDIDDVGTLDMDSLIRHS